MKKELLIPNAISLVESMRSIGYSFETAVTDILDNSVTAMAKKISIILKADEVNTSLTILDDGIGMSRDKLYEAMRYGSVSPTQDRDINDLGRFGLGLKSASLSQCRKLTVISKYENNYSMFCWDIDEIRKLGTWTVIEYQDDEIYNCIYFEKLENLKSGTLVIWEEFDRVAITSNNLSETLFRLMDQTKDHVRLVYHRLIGKNLKIDVNGIDLEPLDPYLSYHPATQQKREQIINVDQDIIKIKPYIIPHSSKLCANDIKKVGGIDNLRSQQGFYIYRNKRLIIWGTWFRLKAKQELYKLARVMVDIPNTLDYMWDIDIKKSQAVLPDRIKKLLLNSVSESTHTSETVHMYKGKKLNNDDFNPMWNIDETREGIKLSVNVESSFIKTFVESLNRNQIKVFENILENIQECLPLQYIYTQCAKETKFIISKEDNDLLERAERCLNDLMNLESNFDINDCINVILSIEPYANNEFVKKKIREKGKYE